MVDKMLKIEMAMIFEIKELNDELEQLIPIGVIEGEYNRKTNTFKSNESEEEFEHIETAKTGSCAFGLRITLGINGEPNEEDIEKIKQDYLEYETTYRFYRYAAFHDKVYISSPGEDMEPLEDIDGLSWREDKTEKISISKPKDIEAEVKKTVKGQDEAIKKIVTSLWMTLNFAKMTKRNMLVIGPSGVGKTIIFRKLQEILGLPLTIFSVPGLSQAGYVGRSTDEILKQAYYDCGSNEQLASRSIVILDEIDKLAFNSSNSGDISTSGVQNELLKIIEGVERNVELNQMGSSFDIDTSTMIFVGTGAFSELYEKDATKHIGFNNDTNNSQNSNKITTDRLIKYGLKRELLGRFPIIVELNPMTKDILKDIILNSDESELRMTLESLKSMGISIDNLDELVDYIAEDAIKMGIGARGLVTTINNIFLEIFYQVANNPRKYEKIVFGPNIVKDNKDFTLLPKQTKKRVRKIQQN